jgi:uncharacterized protein YcbK (DUF882 family)
VPLNPRTHASEHFAWDEFACRDRFHTPYPLDLRETRGRQLAAELEAVRAECCFVRGEDTPLILTSVYRTPAHNKAVGGRPRSRHLSGLAADCQCPFGLTFRQFSQAVLDVAHRPDSKIRYVCSYVNQGFIHLDLRDKPTLLVEARG